MKPKKQQVVIRNINVYLNKEQEKVSNELPELYTHNQRVQHFINYYIVNESKKIMIYPPILIPISSDKGKNLSEFFTKIFDYTYWNNVSLILTIVFGTLLGLVFISSLLFTILDQIFDWTCCDEIRWILYPILLGIILKPQDIENYYKIKKIG